MSCTNDRKTYKHIASQIECQTLCEGEAGCVGIAWSKKQGQDFCYVCNNDILEDVMNNYGCYRRGNKDVYIKFKWAFILSIPISIVA